MSAADATKAGAPGATGRLTIRVYYEDTDFSGRVYHASYLRFLERGRTEWLRERGFEQRVMAAAASIVFVVHHLSVDFIKPALMDDLLTIETRISAFGAASIDFAQTILREGAMLSRAKVGVVALREGRPARLPAEMRSLLAGPAPTSG